MGDNTLKKEVTKLTLSDSDLLSEAFGVCRVGDNEIEKVEIDNTEKKFRYIPLVMNGRTHVVSDGSKSVI